ncbi:MAG: sensor histidine kinase, partial [Gemmatimonadota bacterium]
LEEVGSGRAVRQRARLESYRPVAAAGSRPVPASADARHTLLLVEDDEGLREFLLPLLERDYRVRAAADGVEALRVLDEETPDLVLTDMMMPRMDGETFVRELRKREELDDVPVVVLTAKAEPEPVARLLHLGAQDYLLKPVGVEELRARLENHLDMARSRSILQSELASREDRLRILAGEATYRKRELESLVQEKSVLVQELHHRVKGNLQTITSLLNLQARRLEDSPAREILNQSRGRIAAMALLHERLYQTEDPTETDMRPYVESLVRDVFHSRGGEGDRVRAEVEVESVRLDAERAVRCGLILHELLTNALRHGYGDGSPGTLRVEMRTSRASPPERGRSSSSPTEGWGKEKDVVHLIVEDDGAGFPPDFDIEEADSLGVSLVSALVGQLDGKAGVTSRSGGGARWEIRFPRKPPPRSTKKEGE